MIDNTTQGQLGKTLGRLGCGGVMHYNPAERTWETPRELTVSIGGEVILTLPLTGFDIQRQQHGYDGSTRVTFTAVEP